MHQQKAPNQTRAFLLVVLMGLPFSHSNKFPLQSSFTYTANEIIGKRIKLLREKRGMTQTEFGSLINADKQYVSKLEQGKKNITLDYLDRIATALQVSQSEFLNTNISSNKFHQTTVPNVP